MEIFKVKLIYHLCLSFFLWIQMAPSGVIPFLQHSFIHFCVTVKYITILSICYRPNNTMLQIILCNCLLNQLKKKGKEMLNYTFHHYLHSQLYWKSLFFFFLMKIQITVYCHFLSVYTTSFSTSYMASILAMKSLLLFTWIHLHFTFTSETQIFFFNIKSLVVDIRLSALLMSMHCLWPPLFQNRHQLSFLL